MSDSRHSSDDRGLRRWLEAERRDDTVGAEAALSTLLGDVLPAVEVAPDFASRVLAASGVGSWWRRHSWLWRAALVGWLVAGFAALSAVTGLGVALARSGQAVPLAGRALVAAARGLGELLVGVDGAMLASRAMTELLSQPAAMMFLMICAVATLAAARGLTLVVAPDRRHHHA